MNREEARKKAQALVAQMTVEEKAGQLTYNAPAIPRLGVPAYNWWNEGIHGVARGGQATLFPQAIGLGATFDTELVEEIAKATAIEGRAKYNAHCRENDRDIYKGLTFWAPNINIFRDPRWGRGHETYGEDPWLTGRLGVAFVRGLQGDGETMRAAACAKHFAVHSGPEAVRHSFDAQVTEKDMQETYLPAFRALVEEADVEAVMGAYNRVNGEACCASPALQVQLAKWGFEGHFVSDCWALRDFHENHGLTNSAMESAALAMNNGCHLNCGNTYLHVLNAYRHGLVTEETITEAAVRLFTTRYRLGLFDGSEYDEISYLQLECREHLALCERAAAESFVLLKNDGILPLRKEKLKTVGIIGPNADSRSALAGNYHGTASRYITVQEGILDYLGEDVRVLTSAGCDLFRDRTESLAYPGDRIAEARIVAKNSDVVILCLGLDETLEGEEGDTGNSYASGDKVDLKLPQVQRRLMEAVAETKTPVVLCLMAGSDLDMSYASEHFNAILDLWYPGSMGGAAAAKVLFGELSPSGKLPVTFYETLEELPEFEDYTMQGRTYRYMEHKAQYPFGYGLTYGRVRVTEASVVPGPGEKEMPGPAAECPAQNKRTEQKPETAVPEKTENRGITVAALAVNEGEAAADEVLQVYIKNLDSALAVKNPSLCAFARIHLGVGEQKEVRLHIPGQAFEVVDESGARISDGTHFMLYVGCSQPDEKSRELLGVSPVAVPVEI